MTELSMVPDMMTGSEMTPDTNPMADCWRLLGGEKVGVCMFQKSRSYRRQIAGVEPGLSLSREKWLIIVVAHDFLFA